MKAENEHDDDKNTSEMGEDKIALITENESLEYGRLQEDHITNMEQAT